MSAAQCFKILDSFSDWQNKYRSYISHFEQDYDVIFEYLIHFKGIKCNISHSNIKKTTRPLLFILLSSVLTLSQIFPTMFKSGDIRWNSQGHGPLHKVRMLSMVSYPLNPHIGLETRYPVETSFFIDMIIQYQSSLL